ncbi:hypothetical protein A7982_13506 [Minicystis rosea]|nr:hypothetical protein A7982_13506 [Minicystis rosea]
MKKIVLSLLCAAAMSVSASASALPSQAVFNAFINAGATDIPVGQLFFSLDADIPGQACRYYYEWDSAAVLPLSADGYVLEAKVQGHASCVSNAVTPFATVVQNDSSFPSFGFDRFQQFRQVNLLVLGEDNTDGTLSGIIQFASTPASPGFMTNSITIEVAP